MKKAVLLTKGGKVFAFVLFLLSHSAHLCLTNILESLNQVIEFLACKGRLEKRFLKASQKENCHVLLIKTIKCNEYLDHRVTIFRSQVTKTLFFSLEALNGVSQSVQIIALFFSLSRLFKHEKLVFIFCSQLTKVLLSGDLCMQRKSTRWETFSLETFSYSFFVLSLRHRFPRNVLCQHTMRNS